MHESIRTLIEREHVRRKEASRFIKAAKPFMDELRREFSSILDEYHKEFPDDGRVIDTMTLRSGLGFEAKRRPKGQPRCEVYADPVHRVLRVIQSNTESFTVTMGYNNEGALVLVTTDPTISAFASAVIAPILFPELFELGVSV